MEILEKVIKEKNFKNIYLFFGEEKYLKEKYEKKFIESIVSDATKSMNFNILDGKGVEVDKIKEICDTIPFMNDYRLLIVKNSQLFIEGRKAETENLDKYITNIPETTIILFFEEKVDKRLKIFKNIKKIGDIFEFSFLNEKELSNWALNIFKENEKNISMENIIYLIRSVNGSMETLQNEIDKLINYKKEDKITKEDIDNICTKSIESKVFELIDEIGNKNLPKAMAIYQNLIANKTSPLMILVMIARQLRIILQVKYLSQKNNVIPEIARQLGFRDFIVKQALIQSKNFTNKILLEAINECLEIDNKAKTGLIQDKLGVELFIIKYTKTLNN